MNYKVVLDWVKKNVFIVVFCLLIIAAPLTGWLVGSSLKDGVMKGLADKKSDLDALNALENTQVTLNIPGREAINEKGLVNQKLIEIYGQKVEALRADAESVRVAALQHNSKGRDVLVAGVFPKPDDARRQTIHEQVYPAILDAFKKLLTQVRAGQPPARAQILEALQRRESQFIASTASGGKRTREGLSADDQRRLDEDLTKARKSMCADAARGISFYATLEAIGTPAPPASVPSAGMPLDTMFEWMWRYWISEDLLQALAAANQGAENVLSAPVKRVVQFRVDPLRGAKSGDAAAPSAEGGAPAEAAGGGEALDPKAEVKLDFAASITGRQTNQLYDVRTASLKLVVATSQVPAVVEALAKRNFITVTNLSLRPVDPFAAAREGYMYGVDPVSEVTMSLEMIYLREWTTAKMPEELKRRLGTQGVKPPETAPPASGA